MAEIETDDNRSQKKKGIRRITLSLASWIEQDEIAESRARFRGAYETAGGIYIQIPLHSREKKVTKGKELKRR